MSDASYFDESTTPKLPVAAPLDFIALLKPRVMSLVVFTALAGFLLAPTLPHPLLVFAALFAIAVGAGASGALNMWYDADIDAVMRRTRLRPIPAGRIDTDAALTFGVVLSVLSVFTLGLVSNWLAAALLAFTIFFYVVIYTMWLKRLTPLNIVIGGAAGALLAVAAVWSFLLVRDIDLGEFSTLRTLMLVAIAAGSVLAWLYVEEFLAVRALGMLLLLAAEPLLESAVLRTEPSRLLLVVLAYVWVIAGLFFVGMPYILRDIIACVTAKAWRWQAGSIAGTLYGIALVICAIVFW